MRDECTSVRKKGSLERCTRPVVHGHTFCSIHVRAKKPEIWAPSIHKDPVIKIQSILRGCLIRKYLKLCGPGVLKRSILTNDEELVSCENKHECYPFEFFSFEENGKVWWFDFETIWTWCMKSSKPTNPYTKVPLTTETRKRLRLLWAYRRHHQMYVPSEASTFEERVRNRWNIICQVFEDNGFGEIDPHEFTRMTRSDYQVVARFVESDLPVSLSKTNPYHKLFHSLIFRISTSFYRSNQLQFILHASGAFMYMLCLPKDPYILAFILMSALYRI